MCGVVASVVVRRGCGAGVPCVVVVRGTTRDRLRVGTDALARTRWRKRVGTDAGNYAGNYGRATLRWPGAGRRFAGPGGGRRCAGPGPGDVALALLVSDRGPEALPELLVEGAQGEGIAAVRVSFSAMAYYHQVEARYHVDLFVALAERGDEIARR